MNSTTKLWNGARRYSVMIGLLLCLSIKSLCANITAQFDPVDATANIEAAIAAAGPGGIVTIPYTGQTWWVSTSSSSTANVAIRLNQPNQTFRLEEGVVIRARHGNGHFEHKLSKLMRFDANGVTVEGLGSGATLEMAGTAYTRDGYTTEGGFRHCIRIDVATNATIRNLKIVRAGGDGISIGKGKNDIGLPTDILVEDVFVTESIRLGMAITSGVRITVRNSIFEKSSTEFPMAGIDIEPNHHDPAQRLQDILLEWVTVQNNEMNGFQLGLFNFFDELGQEVDDVSITYRNCRSINNGRWGFHSSNSKPQEAGNGVGGTVIMQNMYIKGSGEHGMQFSGYRVGDAPTVDLRGVTVEDCGTSGINQFPIHFKGSLPGYKLGGIEFSSYNGEPCKIIDNLFDRPNIGTEENPSIDTKGWKDITGTIHVNSISTVFLGLGDGNNWENVTVNRINIDPVGSCGDNLPTEPVISAPGISCGEIILEWEDSDCAEEYIVRRWSDPSQKSVIGRVTTSQFIDNTVAPGVTYTYIVRAKNSNGLVNSNRLNVDVPGCVEDCGSGLPEEPLLVAALDGCNGVSLNWNSDPCTDEFIIRRWTGSSAKETIATISGTSYLDTDVGANTNFSYIVRASNANGLTNSNIVDITTSACGGRLIQRDESYLSTTLRLFPNPAIDILHIEGAGAEIRMIVIRDLTGRIIASLDYPGQQIDLRSFSKGLYTFTLISEEGQQTYRILKE